MYLMVDGPNLSYNSFGWLLLSCFSAFAPVASAKNEEVAGNFIKFLLDPFYSQHSQFHVRQKACKNDTSAGCIA
jgi:hypothetical protein